MEQTLLERLLETHLGAMEMPLHERIYADALDFKAQMDDLLGNFKTTDPKGKQFVGALFGELSSEQMAYGENPLIERCSAIKRGVGLKYDLSANYSKVKTSFAVFADKVIREKSYSCEGMPVFFNNDLFWRDLSNKRVEERLRRQFYRSINVVVFPSIGVDGKIHVWNAAEEVKYRDCEQIRHYIERIENKFNRKQFSERLFSDMIGYVQEMIAVS